MLRTDQSVPKYRQLYEILSRRLDKEWQVGQLIPAEPWLCRQYDVSRNTLRDTIQMLVNEGRLRKEQGRGTFVIAPPADQHARAVSGRRIGFCLSHVSLKGELMYMIRGLAKGLNPWNHALNLYPYEQGIDECEFVLNIARRQFCDGLIFSSLGESTPKVVNELEELSFPYLCLRGEHDQFPAVLAESRVGMTITVRLTALERALSAIARNYRSALFVAVPSPFKEQSLLVRGRRIAEAAGAPVDIRYAEIPLGAEGPAALRDACSDLAGPAVIVIINPPLINAVGSFLENLRREGGRKIDVYQAGLSPEDSIYREAFTTGASPHKHIGEVAARMMLDYLRGLKSGGEDTIIEEQWWDRGTLVLE